MKAYSHLFIQRAEKGGDTRALAYRDNGQWRDMTWNAFYDAVRRTARSLIALGVDAQDRVAIWSHNQPRWTIADLACQLVRAVSVPIYPTNTAQQAAYILKDSQAKVVFVGTEDQLSRALEVMGDLPHIQAVVSLDDSAAQVASEKVLTFDAFLDLGEASHDNQVSRRLEEARPEDLLTLIYTSGTTGEPKGVMLTQSNVLFQMTSHDGRILPCGESDVSLCFLPLSHVFERTWTYYVLHKGMTNAYLDDPKQVMEAMQQVRPTVMCTVPRLLEKIHGAIQEKVQSAPTFRRRMFRWALAVGDAYFQRQKDGLGVPAGLGLRHRVADAMVLSKLKALFGGRIRFMPCAGAPLSAEIERFFCGVGVLVVCGWGLTETTATVTCHETKGFSFGTVGRPLPGLEVRINPRNQEILVRGPNVMQGYYNKPEETAAVFTEDGWFRTGDAGTFDAYGELIITDRIKDLFKTSGGKYIAPQMIETLVGADPAIEQITIVGEGRKCVTALVVPSFENLEGFLQEKGLEDLSREELVKHPVFTTFFRNKIDELTRVLAPHEKIVRFTLIPKEFSQEDGEMTPTLKLKRKVILERYADIIEDMYRKIDQAGKK
ncbi:long-chain acyl-CoA synthetase [Desulfacinum hydrothermale DSM 13146]|uniref:Long-chain acyl-CoA synthetase n=1 Tax=Desulfacinum hydrothermale DSM 13146 TaxID=1121390 RepID=A0A1W1XEZ9_9BACT|nr:long-chain fatty acid--CoA ligase [Desulfacinum hydrothermale]SMC22480.1 long-chain acyl-CoA synthetase [Desulfacinum hydrothermale DSM 13146]